MSHIIHPNELLKPEIESHENPALSEDHEAGNPDGLKCPKCGDTPLHYELHVKVCKGKQKL